jgi:OmpA-OmpF porin, OOP family
MKKLFILSIIVFAASYSISAQTADKKWSIGIHGGLNQYNGDLGNGFYAFEDGNYGMFGINASRYLNRFFDLSITGNYGKVGIAEDDGIVTNPTKSFLANMLHMNLNLRFKFLGNDNYKLSPFIFGGIGLSHYKYLGNHSGKSTDGSFVTGFGLTYHVAPSVSLQLMDNFIFTDYDRVDNVEGPKYYDYYLQHSLGIAFNFGCSKDSDKDGVPDKRDKCPNTPKGVKVNANGCPIDSDGDGVADYLDKCPGTQKGVTVDANGCILDSDGDGVADYLDKCPGTPKDVKVDANGCPFDSDGDGVADYLDKCPDTPKGTKVDAKGCSLDSDGDGVADYLDKCPNTPANVKVDAAGCPPDKDGDGIPDYLDKCPDVKGTAANKGCPEVKKEVQEVFQKALQGIQFETGKDVIRPGSFPILNNVVSIMKENKEYNLIINGHTDNVGKPDANMTLSQKRAEAVKAYLVKNGVEQNRLNSFGYGDTKPVADNKTPEGRAKNRRVEFVVEF